MKIILTISIMIFLAAATTLAASGGSKAQRERSNLPITIKSNKMSVDNKGKTAIFTGKVAAKQGDLTIYADKLTVSYGDTREDVDKIEADGNVRIVQENRIGIANHAVYDSNAGRITLTGNPKVMQGADNITGVTITYFIDEDKSLVSGDGDSPVRAEIHPRPRKSNAGSR
jgi:lipopolysaccharide export system protein LptA